MSPSGATIFKLFSVFQRKNRFVGTSSDTDLSLVDSHLLCEICGSPALQVRHLQDRLGVDGSMLSRTLVSLEQRNLIRVMRPGQDKRQRRVLLSPAGSAALTALDRSANRLLELFTASFSKSEILELAGLLLRLADGLAAPPTAVRELDHPLRPGLRRIARALGIIGSRHLGTEVSSSQRQVLQAIAEEPGFAAASSLQERLRIQQSTLSRMISQLAKLGLISQQALQADRRVSNLSLTAAGQTLLEKIGAKGASMIEEALEGFPVPQVRQLESLLERLVFGGADGNSQSLENGMEIRLLESTAALRAGRAFLVECLIHAEKHKSLDAMLLPPDHAAFGLFAGEELVALCEFAECNGRIALQQLCCKPKAAKSWYYAAFIKLCCRRILRESPETKLYLADTKRCIFPAYPVVWLSVPRGGVTLGRVPFP